MIKRKNIRKLFIVFSIVLIGLVLSGNSYAGEKKKFKWFSIEWEPIRIAFSPTINDAISINRIPLDFRTVPVHPEDPYLKLDPILDESPFFNSVKSDILNLMSVKMWFLSTVALGVGVKTGPYFGKEAYISEYVPLGSPNEVVFGVSAYNYAQHYNNWGPAYVMYQVSRSKELGRSKPFVFMEVKTPTIDFKIGKNGRLGVGLFAGYELTPDKGDICAANGWHRRGEFEQKDRYKLGEIKFNQVYAGLNLETDNKIHNCNMGIKLFVGKYLQKTKVFSIGEDFDLRFKDTPLVFGVGLYISK